MKPIIAAILLTVSCSAQDGLDVKWKSIERDRDGDGKSDLRIETGWRGKSKVMRVVSSKEQSGIWSNSRSYFVKDELLLTEVDGNGDGVFETMVLYHPNQKDMEVFKTQSGGSLRPVHTKLLQAYKLEHAALNGFWDKAFDTNDKSKLEMLFRKTQKDIEEATRHRKQLEANDPDGAVNRSR